MQTDTNWIADLIKQRDSTLSAHTVKQSTHGGTANSKSKTNYSEAKGVAKVHASRNSVSQADNYGLKQENRANFLAKGMS